MTISRDILCLLPIALILGACSDAGTGSAASDTGANGASKPSSMKVSSAKRQCVMQASLGLDMPREAIKSMCGCAIDKLVQNGKFTEDQEPSEEDASAVLDGCITEFLESEEAAQMLEDADQ